MKILGKKLKNKPVQKKNKPVQKKNKPIRKQDITDLKESTSFYDKMMKMFSSEDDARTGSRIVFDLENLFVMNIDDYRVLESYNVTEQTKVYIVQNQTGKTFYLISEPPIDAKGKQIFTRIMHFLYVSLPSSNMRESEIKNILRDQILEISTKLGIKRHTVPIMDSLLYYAMRDFFGYGIIDVPMKDPNLEDIVEERFDMPVGVVHKKYGEFGVLDTNISFSTMEKTNAFVQKLVQRTGKSMTAAVPYIDSMTKEGHRIAATFGKEISIPGPNFTIRKFNEKPFTITKLIQLGTISPLMGAYIWLLIDAKMFLLIIGSTAAGKTTTIGALSSLINPQSKITTIEDTSELKLGHNHWQRLLTRKGTSIFSDKYDVSMDELVRLALRSRPDYIIVGEVRGAEISSLIQAVATGHGGISSFHASNAHAALARMKGPPMNVHLSGQMLISAILTQNRFVDSTGTVTRKVTNITELAPSKDGEYIDFINIFEWNAAKKIFHPTGVIELVQKSIKLKEIAKIYGWGTDELTKQLVTRLAFLIDIIEQNKFDFEEVTKELEKFYYDPLARSMSLLRIKSELES